MSSKVGYCVFVSSIFSENILNDSEVTSKKSLLLALIRNVDDDGESVRDRKRRCLIGAFEWFCAVKNPSIFKKFPLILLNLLNLKIIEANCFKSTWIDNTDFSVSGDSSYMLQSNLISIEAVVNLRRISEKFAELVNEMTQASDDDDDEDPTE